MTTEKLILSEFVKVIPNVVETNLVKADCPVHGKDVYFERIKGDIFRCANYSHNDEKILAPLKAK